MKKKPRVLGSASAFLVGTTVHTTYSTGCLRKILCDSRGIRETFNPKYSRIGEINEAYHAERLTNDFKGYGLIFSAERSVRYPINDEIMFSGRVDFDLYTRVQELKSVSSVNQYKNIIRYGKYKLENLAQLVSYMIARETSEGDLIYTFYQEPEAEVPEISEFRTFSVAFSDEGDIMVDSKNSGFTVLDQLAHRDAAAEVIRDNGKVYRARPHNWNAKWGSPCRFCVFQDTCNQFDTKEITTTEEFLEQAQAAVNEKENT